MIPDPMELRSNFSRRCSSCHMWIMWAWTTTGEQMPLDAQPSPNGNVIAYRDPRNPRRLLVSVYGTSGDGPRRRLTAMRKAGWPTYTHHRVNCPQAEEWARTRGRKGREMKTPPVKTPPTTSRPAPEQGTLL